MKKIFLLSIFLLQFIPLQAYEDSVVCLHGFFRSYKCMLPLANTLQNQGLNVYLWDYPSRCKTIEKHAEDLVHILKGIAQQRPGAPIHFVTHSLGGIIVRVAVNRPDCPKEAKIGRAILYAPPNQGSTIARQLHGCPVMRWIFGKGAGSQLLTYSEDEMACLGDFPQSMEVLVIAGDRGNRLSKIWIKEPNDGKVTVQETRLNTPHQHHTLNVSHSWIMTSRESISITSAFLLKTQPTHFASDTQLDKSDKKLHKKRILH